MVGGASRPGQQTTRSPRRAPRGSPSTPAVADLDKALHPEAWNELLCVFQVDDDLEDLSVDALGRIVGADVLPAHPAAQLGHGAAELLARVRVGQDVRRRSDLDLADVALVDVHPRAQPAR